MNKVIITIGDKVVGRDINDRPTYGVLAGVDPYGMGVIEVTHNTRRNGKLIGVDKFFPKFSMDRIYPQD